MAKRKDRSWESRIETLHKELAALRESLGPEKKKLLATSPSAATPPVAPRLPTSSQAPVEDSTAVFRISQASTVATESRRLGGSSPPVDLVLVYRASLETASIQAPAEKISSTPMRSSALPSTTVPVSATPRVAGSPPVIATRLTTAVSVSGSSPVPPVPSMQTPQVAAATTPPSASPALAGSSAAVQTRSPGLSETPVAPSPPAQQPLSKASDPADQSSSAVQTRSAGVGKTVPGLTGRLKTWLRACLRTSQQSTCWILR